MNREMFISDEDTPSRDSKGSEQGPESSAQQVQGPLRRTRTAYLSPGLGQREEEKVEEGQGFQQRVANFVEVSPHIDIQAQQVSIDSEKSLDAANDLRFDPLKLTHDGGRQALHQIKQISKQLGANQRNRQRRNELRNSSMPNLNPREEILQEPEVDSRSFNLNTKGMIRQIKALRSRKVEEIRNSVESINMSQEQIEQQAHQEIDLMYKEHSMRMNSVGTQQSEVEPVPDLPVEQIATSKSEIRSEELSIEVIQRDVPMTVNNISLNSIHSNQIEEAKHQNRNSSSEMVNSLLSERSERSVSNSQRDSLDQSSRERSMRFIQKLEIEESEEEQINNQLKLVKNQSTGIPRRQVTEKRKEKFKSQKNVTHSINLTSFNLFGAQKSDDIEDNPEQEQAMQRKTSLTAKLILKGSQQGLKNLHKQIQSLQNTFILKEEKKPEDIRDQLMKDLDEETQLSITSLNNHILQNHPMQDTDKHYPLTSSTGLLFKVDEKSRIPQFLTDVGLGPSIYLLTLKSLFRFFLFLTLLNIPTFYLLLSGDEKEIRGFYQFSNILSALSLGNLGQNEVICHSENLAMDKRVLNLECMSGQIVRIIGYGLSKEKHQKCHNDLVIDKDDLLMIKNKNDYSDFTQFRISELIWQPDLFLQNFNHFMSFERACSSLINREVQYSEFQANLARDFKAECKGQRKCQVPIDYSQLNQECIEIIEERARYSIFDDLIKRVYGDLTMAEILSFNKVIEHHREFKRDFPEPELQVLFECQGHTVQLAWTDTVVSKKTVSVWLSIIDLVSMLSVVIYSKFLITVQKDFAKKFDQETVCIKHFTLVITNLPEHFKQFPDEVSMKYAIWEQINNKLQFYRQDELINNPNLDSLILDINFGLTDSHVFNKLKVIEQQCDNIEFSNLNLKKYKNDFGHLKSQQQKILNLRKSLAKHLARQQVEMEHQQRKGKQRDYYKKIKFVFITFQSMEAKQIVQDILFRKDGQVMESTRRINMQQTMAKIKQIQSDGMRKSEIMQQQQLVMTKSINNIGNLFSNLKDKFQQKKRPVFLQSMRIQQRIKAQLELQIELEKERLNEEVKTKSIVDPEFIQWESIGFGRRSQLKRKCLSFCLLLVMLGLQIGARMFSRNLIEEQQMGTIMQSCDNLNVTMKQAYNDVILNWNEGEANHAQDFILLHCFCETQLKTNTTNFFKINFDGMGDQPIHYDCIDWSKDKIKQEATFFIGTFLSILITMIAQEVFLWASKNEKHFHKTKENYQVFKLMFVLMFLEYGLLLTFTNQFIVDSKFQSAWFATDGSQLCLTMMMLIFSSQGSDISSLMLIKLTRFYDRKFSFRMHRRKKSQSGKRCEIPNTRQLRQKDLNNLYTGPQIRIGFKFAYIFTFIFVCIMFSFGIPLLFPIAMMFFLITYWIEKYFILRFYQKAREFDKELPIESTNLIKYAVILHYIMVLLLHLLSDILDPVTEEKDQYDTSLSISKEWYLRLFQSFDHMTITIGVFILFCLINYLVTKFVPNIEVKVIEKLRVLFGKYKQQKQAFRDNSSGSSDGSCDSSNNDGENEEPLPVKKRVTFQIQKDIEEKQQLKQRGQVVSLSTKQLKMKLTEQLNLHFLGLLYNNTIEQIKNLLTHYNENYKDSVLPDDQQKAKLFKDYIASRYQVKKIIETQIETYYAQISETLTKQLKKKQTQKAVGEIGFIQNIKDKEVQGQILDANKSEKKLNFLNMLQLQGNNVSKLGKDCESQLTQIQNLKTVSNLNRWPTKILDVINFQEAEFVDQECESLEHDSDHSHQKNSDDIYDKLFNMMSNFDQEQLRKSYFKNSINCKSFTQSYNIQDNQEFMDIDNSLLKAQVLIDQPFLF